jgi:hypothetical protein
MTEPEIFVQPENAEELMLTTDFPMVRVSKPEPKAKALDPILVTESGIVKEPLKP